MWLWVKDYLWLSSVVIYKYRYIVYFYTIRETLQQKFCSHCKLKKVLLHGKSLSKILIGSQTYLAFFQSSVNEGFQLWMTWTAGSIASWDEPLIKCFLWQTTTTSTVNLHFLFSYFDYFYIMLIKYIFLNLLNKLKQIEIILNIKFLKL